MPQLPLDPPVADTAPNADVLTGYDEEHLVTYLRLLDAEAEGADWTEVARLGELPQLAAIMEFGTRWRSFTTVYQRLYHSGE